MNVTLQKHDAKHIYKVPEGLRELCTDISREVLRSQPVNLYDFIAEYVDTLLITRENTKVAVKVVNNILLESQAILSILYRAGFSLEQIAIAAPRIQKAFRDYLDAIDIQPVQICEDYSYDEKSKVSIRNILEATGATHEEAERAATVIQSAFRGHYERMALNEAQGKVQWQRAVTNTLDILKKAGATQAEILKAARHIKFAYRGYYIRRNQKIDIPEAEERYERDERILEPAEAIQAVAWMEMMYQDSGLTMEKANDAASVIQIQLYLLIRDDPQFGNPKSSETLWIYWCDGISTTLGQTSFWIGDHPLQRAYRKYRTRKGYYDVQRLESTKSLVVEAIVENLRQRVFDKVISREDIPTEYGTREEIVATTTKLQLAFKEHLRLSRISKEGFLESSEVVDEELPEDETEEDEETEEISVTEPSPRSQYPEEQVTKEETDEQYASEADVTEEQLLSSPEVQSEPETDYPTELETEEDAEEQETKEDEEDEQEAEEMEEKEEEEPNVAQEIGPAGDRAVE